MYAAGIPVVDKDIPSTLDALADDRIYVIHDFICFLFVYPFCLIRSWEILNLVVNNTANSDI